MKQAHIRAYGPYKVAHDGCEWNPDRHRGAEVTDSHFRRTRATTLVGRRAAKGGIVYRLCDACAALPLFRTRPQSRIKHVTARAS